MMSSGTVVSVTRVALRVPASCASVNSSTSVGFAVDDAMALLDDG